MVSYFEWDESVKGQFSRKNFVLIDTVEGVEASTIMFSMSETLKASSLKGQECFKYVLTEMSKYVRKNIKDHTFVEQFFPWSDKLSQF